MPESTKTSESLPVINFDTFKNSIAEIESGGNYNVINKKGSSATGKYQFIWDGGKDWGGWKSDIEKVTGAKTQDEFLSSPDAQEKFMDHVIQNNYVPAISKLKANNPDLVQGYNDEQLMALVHFQGANGAKNYLQSGTEINAENNISVEKYLTPFGDVPERKQNTEAKNTESSAGVVNTSANSQYKPLPNVSVGSVDNYEMPDIDYSVVGDNTKVDNTIPYKPMSAPKVNTSFTGQGSLFKTGGNMNKYLATGGPMGGMPTEGQAGQLTSFDAGGKHEENPMGGIPQGMNPNGQQNLVEEGETKHNAKNYIFSDTLKVDKNIAKEFYFPSKYIGKTFAEVSKLMERPNSRRKHDSIEEKAKTKDLDSLMTAQEEHKAKDLEKDMQNMMVKHPEFMQSMMASQEPQMPQEGMMDPMMAQDPAMQGMPMESPMAKMGGYQNQMDFGGFMNKVGQVGKNAGLALADNVLGAVGANNVIKDSDYTGAGSQFAQKAQKFTGAVTNIGAGIAANALLPGVGGAVLSGVQGAMGGVGGENTTIQNGVKVPVQMASGGPLSFSLGTDEELLSSVDHFGNPKAGYVDGLTPKSAGAIFGNYGSDSLNKSKKSIVGVPKASDTELLGGDYGLDAGPEKQGYDQSLMNAIGTYAPAAYNIGKGLFGKVDKLNADDYINNAKIGNYRENINPQLRASDEAFAGARKGMRNAGAGYMANLQALHSQDQASKAGIHANAENQYAGRQLQIDQLNAARGDQAAAKRLQIHDYNARAAAAKERMLQEGLKQTGDISKSKTSNELATMYNNLYAPDFKDYASYKSYTDTLWEKMQKNKKNA
jgi:hypothetical protein